MFVDLLQLILLVAFANRELVLPDIGMIHGRMIVSAWDYGLEGVNDNAVRLLLNSIEVCSVV